MDLLTWVLLGLIAGTVAHIISPTATRGGIIGNLVVGIVGALVGGYLGNLLFGVGVSGFNLPSILVAIVGSIIVLYLYRLVVRRT